jgi:DNA-binding transcriptional ArsR family regulator
MSREQQKSPGREPGREGSYMTSEYYNTGFGSEEYVLGALLVDPKWAKSTVAKLKCEDFSDKRHALIFSAIEELVRKGVAVDELMVFEHLRAKNVNIPFAYFGQLRDAFITEATLPYHIAQLKGASLARKEWEILQCYSQALQNGADAETRENYRGKLRALWENVNISSGSKLRPIPASELPSAEPVESIWGGLFFPGAITQINSEPGVGKTTLIYNFCYHGAVSKSFLGIPFSGKVRSLYVDLETPGWLRRAKLVRIAGSEELPSEVHFLNELNLRRDFSDLVALCREQSYNFIIFDTQSRVLGMTDENDAAEANEALNLMRQLTKQTRCALCLVHHIGKSDNVKGVYRGRGSSAIAGGVDIVANLEALAEDAVRISFGKNRILGTNPTLHLRKSGEDMFERYTPPGEESGFSLFEAQRVILSLHDEERELWTTAEICEEAEKMGFSKRTVERALRRLIEVGRIERIGKGKYRFRQIRQPLYNGGSGGTPENEEIPEFL